MHEWYACRWEVSGMNLAGSERTATSGSAGGWAQVPSGDWGLTDLPNICPRHCVGQSILKELH